MSNTSLAHLPTELLIQIFSYLDPFVLDNTIGYVCKNWNHIINNNELWRETFKKTFGTTKFNSLSKSKTWRDEFILRDQVLRKWLKSTSLHKNFFIQNMVLTDLATDFSNDKLVMFSDRNGTASVANITNGKNGATMPVCSPSQTTVYKLTKSCILFGRYDGKVYAKLLNTKSYLSDVVQFHGATHVTTVTAIDCVENISGKDDIVGCISGDAEGNLMMWDLKNTKYLEGFKVSSNPIVHLYSNYKDTIIVQDTEEIIVISKKFHISGSPYKVKTISTDQIGEMVVDFGMRQCVIASGRNLCVYSFDTHSFGSCKKYHTAQDIYKISIDNNSNKDVDSQIVGDDCCMLGVILEDHVLIFNIRLDSPLLPTLTIRPHFKLESIPRINSILLNSLVVLVGMYNGYCGLFNVLTGAFIRTASIRIPRRLLPMEYNIPVNCLALNEDNFMTNGVILCGNVAQYFQFGDLSSLQRKQQLKRPKGVISERKFAIQRGIKSELDDMNYEYQLHEQESKLLNKYNGDQFDEDEEFQMALLLSQSMDPPTLDEDLELARLLQLSVQEQQVHVEDDVGEGSSSYLEDDLAKVLRLSLHDQ